jgi:hypothetical protein
MRFKDIFEAPDKYPWGDTGGFNPNRRRHAPQIGGRQVNPIKDTDVPVDPVKGSSVYDQERELQKQQNLTGAGRKGKLPASASPGASAEPGLSPRERGLNPKNTPTSPAMQKVNQALQGVDINKLNPEQKKSLIAKVNDVLKSSKKLKSYGAPGKALAVLGMLGSAGLEYLDPELVNESLLDEVISLNEAQFYIWQIDGNSALVSPVGPQGPAPKEQARRVNIGQKVLDMSTGMPTLRDKISPVGKDVQLTGQIVDIQGRIT